MGLQAVSWIVTSIQADRPGYNYRSTLSTGAPLWPGIRTIEFGSKFLQIFKESTRCSISFNKRSALIPQPIHSILYDGHKSPSVIRQMAQEIECFLVETTPDFVCAALVIQAFSYCQSI